MFSEGRHPSYPGVHMDGRDGVTDLRLAAPTSTGAFIRCARRQFCMCIQMCCLRLLRWLTRCCRINTSPSSHAGHTVCAGAVVLFCCVAKLSTCCVLRAFFPRSCLSCWGSVLKFGTEREEVTQVRHGPRGHCAGARGGRERAGRSAHVAAAGRGLRTRLRRRAGAGAVHTYMSLQILVPHGTTKVLVRTSVV